MRKIMMMALAAAAVVGCTSPNAYTISGSKEELKDGSYVFLSVVEGRNLKNIDSVLVEKGAFKFKGEVEKPYAAYITTPAEDGKRQGMIARLFVEAGKIAIAADEKEAKLMVATGTPSNDNLLAHNSTVRPLREAMMEARKANDKEAYDKANAAIAEATLASIKQNGSLILGKDLLSNAVYTLKPEQIIEAVGSLSEEYQQQEAILKMKEQAEKSLKVAPGNPYIDITQNSPKGKAISLKSVIEDKKTKFVLLDFWASWCGPCMGEVPHLKETYDKYNKKGFEIYAVSLDRDRDAWVKAIEEKKMNWVHVSDVKYWDTPARNDYAVNSIPANFLIDCSTGKIVATGLRGEALEKKIEELLK